MSAFVVEDQTINIVVSWMNEVCMAGYSHKYFYDLLPLTKLGYKLDNPIGPNRLAEDMFTLNCDSIEQRYGEGQAEEFRPLDFNYKFAPSGVNIYHILKFLRCFLYQCCEGNIPQQNTLYNALETVSLKIAGTIVNHLPEYETAPWGH